LHGVAQTAGQNNAPSISLLTHSDRFDNPANPETAILLPLLAADFSKRNGLAFYPTHATTPLEGSIKVREINSQDDSLH
jgi:hypothetical protein